MKNSGELAEILKEFSLEADDIRWFLSVEKAQNLLDLQAEPKTLIRMIWSGELEASLYRCEDRFLEEIEQDLETRKRDSSQIRELVQDILRAKRIRYRK